jgi:hypothetical protein
MNLVQPKLFMLLLGCKPEGRNVEQHDVFFGIGSSLKSLVPAIKAFWPEGKKGLHVDAWREVTRVQNYVIRPRLKSKASEEQNTLKLFFINLGGYRRGEFEEHHYKMLVVAKDSAGAVKLAKKEKFYKQTGFKEAPSHIDEKYGIDVDDIYSVKEILPAVFAAKYILEIIKEDSAEDFIELGYLPVSKIK